MGLDCRKVGLTFALNIVLMSSMVGFVKADAEKDKQECAGQLVGLATCLPYVGGNAKTPTPDCCTGLKELLKNEKKCLCVVIKDRNDPDLGLKINVTLALGLPTACHAVANVSECPALLHLAPNSPDAQVFYQFGKSSQQSASSPALSPSDEGSPTSGNSQGQSAQPPSSGCDNGKGWFALEFFSLSFSLSYFLYSKLLL